MKHKDLLKEWFLKTQRTPFLVFSEKSYCFCVFQNKKEEVRNQTCFPCSPCFLEHDRKENSFKKFVNKQGIILFILMLQWIYGT